jgi:selenocysteine-specific elongation factor
MPIVCRKRKKRGMTIDLGYAYWPQPDGRVLGFIDVLGTKNFFPICWRAWGH